MWENASSGSIAGHHIIHSPYPSLFPFRKREHALALVHTDYQTYCKTVIFVSLLSIVSNPMQTSAHWWWVFRSLTDIYSLFSCLPEVLHLLTFQMCLRSLLFEVWICRSVHPFSHFQFVWEELWTSGLGTLGMTSLTIVLLNVCSD